MELEQREESKSELVELVIPSGSPASGKQIVNLGLPVGTLIILLAKGKEQFSPRGDTVLEEGDALLTLTTSDNFSVVRRIILGETSAEPDDTDLHEIDFPIDFLRRYR
jgi:cell volume regulation protein A